MLSLGELHYLRYSNPVDEMNDQSDIHIKMRTRLRMESQRGQESNGGWTREVAADDHSYMNEIRESVNSLTDLKSNSNDHLKKILKIAPKPPQRSLSLNASACNAYRESKITFKVSKESVS